MKVLLTFVVGCLFFYSFLFEELKCTNVLRYSTQTDLDTANYLFGAMFVPNIVCFLPLPVLFMVEGIYSGKTVISLAI
jgi:hypothetical protein